MFLQRQISATLVEGEKTSIADGSKFPYKLVDVLPKYILRLGEGKVTSGYFSLAADDATNPQLPQDYDGTVDRLSCIIRSTNIVKVQCSSTTFGSTEYLLKATNSTDEGQHFGMLMFQGDVTSMDISVPTGFEDAEVEYFFWVIPDLDLATSWQLGQTAIGYTENNF